ncbi:MAG: type II toxin-antitoxin system PemK/MazF family toxin [Lactobacillaceae bacterium]|jgi:mRNA interferase MazF|nr:type II toxin-antitoxin system PemK/MazF family toxin [Lactobacillaceae bacterium]
MAKIQRGDIYYANLNPAKGSEQGGFRPVLIIQNNSGNIFSPTTIIAVFTSKQTKAQLPTHVEVSQKDVNIKEDSLLLLEQIRTIDKSRLKNKIDTLPDELMDKVDEALKISVGLSKRK